MAVINTEKADLYANVETVTVDSFAEALNLEISYKGRGYLTLNSVSVSRPGLQLAGYFKHFDHNRVQLIGNAEHEYLLSMNDKDRARVLSEFFKRDVPCVIFANNLHVLPSITEYAKQYNCPILKSKQITTVLAHELTMYQEDLLAPTKIIHGVFVEVFGVGVLITGNAGIGKSETALELITRGHRLIADDSVIVKNKGDLLMGKSPDNIRYYMEVRGIGIINVQTMYGPGSIRPEKTVDIVVELQRWQDGKEYERLGDVKITSEILGIEKPTLIIPVSPGRNIPVIIETAARKYRLDQTGYDATQELISRTFKK